MSDSPSQGVAAERAAAVPSRWTLHGLNNGVIFAATCRSVAVLPRSASYAIGKACTWLAWRLMTQTRAALIDNLRALFPDASEDELDARSLQTLRAYAYDVIDFLRAIEAPAAQASRMFEWRPRDEQLFRDRLAHGRGVILVTGHYGNWEIGGVFMRRVIDLPLTIVTMAEANPEVNRIRRQIRDDLDIDTIEVRQSLDTALQITRRLADNRVVAMLMDRHLGRDRVDVSLLGRTAGFLRTPALLGYLSGAPLVPCFIERLGEGRFSVTAGEPIDVRRDVPRDEAIQEAAQRMADQLGARITSHPEFWYHFYPYWKVQTEGYESLPQ